MELTERLDLDAIIRRGIHASIRTIILFFIVTPPLLLGFWWLLARSGGQTVPLWSWVGASLFLLFGGLIVKSELSDLRMLNSGKHDFYNVPMIGNYDQVKQIIEKEWNDSSAKQKYRYGDYYLTPNWLLVLSGFSGTIKFYPLRTVAWAFYGSPMNYDEDASLHGMYVRRRICPGSHNKVTIVFVGGTLAGTPHLSFSAPPFLPAHDFLDELQKRAPWGFYGFEQPYCSVYNTKAFADSVKKRYTLVQSGQPVPPTDETLFNVS